MDINQAIVTKYIGPGNVKGSRVKATCEGGKIVIAWDGALNSEQNHAKAAQTLANKLNWGGWWIGGGLPNNGGKCWVQYSGDGADMISEFAHFISSDKRKAG